VPASDIDILVVYRSLPASMIERGRVKVELLEKAGIPYYEDVHIELITERDMWYYKRRCSQERPQLSRSWSSLSPFSLNAGIPLGGGSRP